MTQTDEQRFVTPEFEARYVWLDKKKEPSEGFDGDPQWTITMALDKDHPFWEELKAKIEIAIENKFGEEPKNCRSPIKDGDDWEDEFFHGKWVISMVNSRRKPVVKVYNEDGENQEVVNYDEEIYPGMICVCTARAGGYSKGSKGINTYLNNVLKVDDGERTGPTTPSNEADFGDFVRGKGKKKGSKKSRRKKRGKVDPLA